MFYKSLACYMLIQYLCQFAVNTLHLFLFWRLTTQFYVPLQKNTQIIPPTTPPIAAPITVPLGPKIEPILPPMDAPGPNPVTNLSKPELLLVM